jgi:hypothetical protein
MHGILQFFSGSCSETEVSEQLYLSFQFGIVHTAIELKASPSPTAQTSLLLSCVELGSLRTLRRGCSLKK